jgi:hypothetical protein
MVAMLELVGLELLFTLPVLQLTSQLVNNPSKAQQTSCLNFSNRIIVVSGNILRINLGKKKMEHCGDYRIYQF